jgi:hypothetical protein
MSENNGHDRRGRGERASRGSGDSRGADLRLARTTRESVFKLLDSEPKDDVLEALAALKK